MRIVGTAGHVDHGKSSLVLSLTGHNPDRWVEERERGMTLDLGFAPLRFDDGVEAGIIDVPGHERFIHNMLAGAAGIDVLLLVIDALEGPRAQTREHLQILNFLNVSRAIVVLTKSDLADEPTLELAAEDTRAAVAGTIAEGAPVIAVSNVNGAGIDALKTAIHDALAHLPAPRADAPAYLPVDRVFALPGHGTIVTGTLIQGTVRAGDTLTLQPAGRPARVRSLQIFGRKVQEAGAGARLAVNIPGIDVNTTHRGDVLTASNAFEAISELAIRFTPLASTLEMLRKRTPVRVHIGSAEIEGRLVLAERPAEASPVRATLLLAHPTVAYPGTRLIVRRLSPKDLLGGGIVTSTANRRGDAALRARLERSTFIVDRHGHSVVDRTELSTLSELTHPDDAACLAAIEASSLKPLSLRTIASLANVLEPAARAAVERLIENGRIIAIAKPVEYLSRAAFDEAFARAAAVLRERHNTSPWRLGCSSGELAKAVGVDDGLMSRLLASWYHDGRLGHRARFWHLPDFSPSLTKEQRTFFDGALSVDPASPLLPRSYDDLMGSADAQHVVGAREALESLTAVGAVSRIGGDLYRRSQLESARSIVRNTLADNGATTSQLRVALGTTRKYALPLLEFFDSEGLTLRDGDVRRLRTPAGKAAAKVQK